MNQKPQAPNINSQNQNPSANQWAGMDVHAYAQMEERERNALAAEQVALSTATSEAEARAKAELEAGAKAALEASSATATVIDQVDQAPNNADDAPISLDGFFAIRANFDEDKKAAAKDYAERAVTAEAAKEKNVFKKLWKGTLAKKYYERKYAREIEHDERKVEQDGKEMSLSEVFASNQAAALERFRRGINEDLQFEKQGSKELSKYIHDSFGEDYRVDEKATSIVQKAIKDFVKDHQETFKTGNADPKQLKINFDEYLGRYQAEAKDNGVKFDHSTTEEYSNAALQALELSNHSAGIDNCLDGFKIYEAKIRDGARTEAHKNAFNKILDKFESHPIPPIMLDAIAGASGAAMALAQGAARGALGVFGLLVPALASGAKEYGRITNDRTRMLRDQELGIIYEHTGKTKQEIKELGLKRAEKKRALRESKIGTTLYETTPAKQLISDIQDAKDRKALLVALTVARSSIDFADQSKKGVISYSPGKAGDERLALDIATIEAEKTLSEKERTAYQAMLDIANKKLTRETKNKDKDFNKLRLAEAAKKSAKTLTIGTIGFFVSQEAIAALSPSKIGVLEKYGILKTSNDVDASETLLAKGVGSLEQKLFGTNTNSTFTVATTPKVETHRISGDDTATMQKFESQGYAKTRISEGKELLHEVPDVESTSPAGSVYDRTVQYDGWANNGTKLSDGNELRAYLSNGQFTSNMMGNSTFTSGQSLSYRDLVDAGSVKGYLTIGGAKLEVVSKVNETGQLTWGENGVFEVVSADGSTTTTIRAISENGEKLYKYFEIAVDNGSSDGIQHIIPLATDIGRNTFSGTIEQVVTNVEKITEPAIYEFTKQIPQGVTYIRDLDTTGIFSLAALNDLLQSRTNLSAPVTNVERETPTSATPEVAPEPTPATPEAVSGTSPAIPETEPTPASSETPPASPEASSATAPIPETASSAEIDFRNSIEAARSLIGDEGVAIMTANTPPDDAFQDRFKNWWSALSDDAKDAVRTIKARLDQDPALKSLNWGSAASMLLTLNP